MKSLIKNKKGIEINIATIIILVLAILVLVILAMYFTGGMTSLWSQIIGKKVAYTGSALDDAKNKCENLFTVDQYCTQKVDVYNSANKTVDYKCCWEIATLPNKPTFIYDSPTGERITLASGKNCVDKLHYDSTAVCTPDSN